MANKLDRCPCGTQLLPRSLYRTEAVEIRFYWCPQCNESRHEIIDGDLPGCVDCESWQVVVNRVDERKLRVECRECGAIASFESAPAGPMPKLPGALADSAEYAAEVIRALRIAGAGEEFVYAFQKTRLLISDSSKGSVPEERVAEFSAAVEEFFLIRDRRRTA